MNSPTNILLWNADVQRSPFAETADQRVGFFRDHLLRILFRGHLLEKRSGRQRMHAAGTLKAGRALVLLQFAVHGRYVLETMLTVLRVHLVGHTVTTSQLQTVPAEIGQRDRSLQFAAALILDPFVGERVVDRFEIFVHP